MTPNKNSDNTRDNAIYLMGFNDAMVAMYALREIGVVPALKKIQTKEYKDAINTVVKIMNGGVDNPIDLWKMNEYVKKLEGLLKDMAAKI